MTHFLLAGRKRNPFFRHGALSRDEFVGTLLPWLIGVPVSLIMIRVFSL